MTNETIYFEKANLSDLQSIWFLLHADSKMMKEKQILERMNDLYILRYRQRILGVLCGNYHAGKVTIDWVVIHPLYPESDLREVMIWDFSVILCREPENPSKIDSSLLQWIKRSKAQFRKKPFFIRTEGV